MTNIVVAITMAVVTNWGPVQIEYGTHGGMYDRGHAKYERVQTGEVVEQLGAAEKHGKSLKMDFDCMSRDGLFDDDQVFAVWEKADVQALIERLKACLEA